MDQQTTNPDQMNFHQQTNTFDLTVTLTDNNLSIVLEDYVDWAIYSRDYTEDDVGKEIHKKMELFDVYNAFSQTQHQCDEEKQEKVKQYEFGTVVENSQKLPCYKIQKQGKISVYLNMMDRKTKKELNYQSKLQLTKIKEMTEAQISAHKLSKEKRLTFQDLKKQIQEQKQARKNLMKWVIDLEQENIKLKEELKTIKSSFKELQENQKKKNSQFQEKIIQLIAYNKKEITEQLLQKGIKTREQIQQKVTQQIAQNNHELQKKINQKLIQTNQQLTEKTQQLQKRLSFMELSEIPKVSSSKLQGQSSIQYPSTPKKIETKDILNTTTTSNLSFEEAISMKAEDIHGLRQANTKYFMIDGLKVKYTGENEWKQYMFNYKILPKQSYKFQLKIVQTKARHLKIGVADYEKLKDNQKSFNTGHAMCYRGSNGRKWPDDESQGYGYGKGHVLEVSVDRVSCIVTYKVNGVLNAVHCNQILSDAARVFVPFVEMHEKNDEVEWVL